MKYNEAGGNCRRMSIIFTFHQIFLGRSFQGYDMDGSLSMYETEEKSIQIFHQILLGRLNQGYDIDGSCSMHETEEKSMQNFNQILLGRLNQDYNMDGSYSMHEKEQYPYKSFILNLKEKKHQPEDLRINSNIILERNLKT
jgi:hypothetical protein